MRKESLEEVFNAILDISVFHNLYLEYGRDRSYWVSKSIKIKCDIPLKRKENLLNIELFTDKITILKFNYNHASNGIRLYSFKELRIVLNIIHGLIGKDCKYCTLGA